MALSEALTRRNISLSTIIPKFHDTLAQNTNESKLREKPEDVSPGAMRTWNLCKSLRDQGKPLLETLHADALYMPANKEYEDSHTIVLDQVNRLKNALYSVKFSQKTDEPSLHLCAIADYLTAPKHLRKEEIPDYVLAIAAYEIFEESVHEKHLTPEALHPPGTRRLMRSLFGGEKLGRLNPLVWDRINFYLLILDNLPEKFNVPQDPVDTQITPLPKQQAKIFV